MKSVEFGLFMTPNSELITPNLRIYGCPDSDRGLDRSSHLLSERDPFSFGRVPLGMPEERFQRGPNHPRKGKRRSDEHRPFFFKEKSSD